MTYFALSLFSVIGVFAGYLVKTKKWSHLGYLLVMITCFTGLLIVALYARPYSVRGAESFYQEGLLFLCTILGLNTNVLAQRMKGQHIQIHWTDFVKASSVAPCIFLAVWGIVEKMVEFNVTICCFAYTNGYFWETIFTRAKHKLAQKFDIFLPFTDSLIQKLPANIQELYLKALKVRDDPEAFAVRLGKVLETVCMEKNAPGTRLYDQIESLARNSTIQKQFVTMAHQLRKLRNIGAHTTGVELTPTEVPILDDLVRAILEYVYITPGLIAQVQSRIDGLGKEDA